MSEYMVHSFRKKLAPRDNFDNQFTQSPWSQLSVISSQLLFFLRSLLVPLSDRHSAVGIIKENSIDNNSSHHKEVILLNKIVRHLARYGGRIPGLPINHPLQIFHSCIKISFALVITSSNVGVKFFPHIIRTSCDDSFMILLE